LLWIFGLDAHLGLESIAQAHVLLVSHS
jgi:hypothetical protein